MLYRSDKGARIWLGTFFVLGIVATLLTELLATSLHGKERKPGPNATLTGNNSTNRVSKNELSGPWGTLEYERISLENPDYVFLDRPVRLQKPRWFFENISAPQLTSFLGQCDLTTEQKNQLLQTSRWEILTNGIALYPTDDLILNLSSKARFQLFSTLARSEANYVKRYPFRFTLKGFDEQFANSRLPVEKIALLKGTLYTNAGAICLAVGHPLLSVLNTNQFQELVNTLYGIPTFNVKLRVPPDANIDELLRYWGKAGNAKTARPLLESLARNPNGGSINVSFFFPPFARLRLYTYPDPVRDPAVSREDCFYTAFNFCKAEPDPQFMDSRVTTKVLRDDYYPIQEQPAFGDLLTLLDASGAAVHVCVYIAGDFVFTKNGANYLQPWVLMKLSDVVAFYPSERPFRIAAFRHKSPESGAVAVLNK